MIHPPTAPKTAQWYCDCGTVAFEMSPVKGVRCICYCTDCRAFLTHLNRTDIADTAGGTDLFQTTPDRLACTKGADQLACLRLTKTGPMRWYTTCCTTPVCNTGATRLIPLASLLVRSIDDTPQLGPVIAHVNRKDATAPIDADTGNLRNLILSFAKNAALCLISGRFRKTPFFTPDGTAVAKPKRLTTTERDAAYGG